MIDIIFAIGEMLKPKTMVCKFVSIMEYKQF